jgi:hypothetical protein
MADPIARKMYAFGAFTLGVCRLLRSSVPSARHNSVRHARHGRKNFSDFQPSVYVPALGTLPAFRTAKCSKDPIQFVQIAVSAR